MTLTQCMPCPSTRPPKPLALYQLYHRKKEPRPYPPMEMLGSVSSRARLGRGVVAHEDSLSTVTHSSNRRSPAART